MTVKCSQCEYENLDNAEKCQSCGTILTQTDDGLNTMTKQDTPMNDNSEIEEKLSQTSLVMPPDEAELKADMKATIEVTIEDNLELEDSVPVFKDDAQVEVDGEALDKSEISDDETLATAKMPNLDDDDGLLHIGSVRFRGHLLLTEKESGVVHRIENEQLEEALIGRLDIKTGFRPLIDFTNTDGKELGVSRRHATISQRGDLIFVTDHNSLNGTYLNGQRLVPEQARVMRDSDILRIGHVTLIVSFEDVIIGS